MCILVADRPAPAALRTVCATGAMVETNARPELGSRIELHHPEAGIIDGIVRSISNDGVGIGFTCSEASMAFALAAITADMSRPI